LRGSAAGPACGEYGVLDVQALAFPGVSYKESQDHSKWAVGVTGAEVCVADINRMTTQYKRGGGAICWNDTALSSTLRSAIVKTDACASNKHKTNL
jgi:deoxyribonuclease-2